MSLWTMERYVDRQTAHMYIYVHVCNAANLVVSSTVKYTLPYKQLLYRGQKSILSVAGSTTPVRHVRQKPDHYYCDCMGTWGSLVSLRGMVTPIPISLVILGWGSPYHCYTGTSLVPRPFERRRKKGLVHTVCACSIFPANTGNLYSYPFISP